MFSRKVPAQLAALWPKLKHGSRRPLVRWAFSALLILLVTAGLGYMLYDSRDLLLSYEWRIRPLPLLTSFLLYSCALALAILVWGLIINRLSGKRRWLRHIQIYCLSNLAQRLPGVLWHVVGRMAMYQHDGVSKRAVSIGSGLELLLLIVSGLLVSLATWPLLRNAGTQPWPWFLAGIVLGLLLLHPRLMQPILRRLGISENIWQPRDLGIWLTLHVSVWLLGGIILFTFINTVYPLPLNLLPAVVAAWCVSGVISTVSTFTPSSFGLREVTLSAFLTPVMPAGIAVVVAIAIRAVLTVYEIVWALITSRLVAILASEPATNQENSTK